MPLRLRLLLVALLGAAALLAAAPGPAGAIVGGRPTADGEAGWMVALVDRGLRGRPLEGHFCGGALIGPRTVLTAAHCVVFGGRPVVARTRVLPDRSPDRATAPVAETVVHPGFKPSFEEESELGDPHDIALLRLRRPLPGPYLRPAARGDAAAWQPGSELRAFGWGNRSRNGPNLPRQLHTGAIERFQDGVCDDRYGRAFDPATMFCGGRADGSVDTCEGDSGGPVLGLDAAGRDVLVGLVSFGHRCGLAEWPGVYTRVSRYERWLASRPRSRR
jgi:secreted trypsin-like serine protease